MEVGFLVTQGEKAPRDKASVSKIYLLKQKIWNFYEIEGDFMHLESFLMKLLELLHVSGQELRWGQ